MKILVIDHHELPEGIAPAMQRTLSPIHGIAVLESASLRGGIEYCDHHDDVDLVIVDIARQGGHGVNAIDQLLARHPLLRVAALVSADDPAAAAAALRHGACGCVAKSSTAEAFVAALQPLLPLASPPKRARAPKLPA